MPISFNDSMTAFGASEVSDDARLRDLDDESAAGQVVLCKELRDEFRLNPSSKRFVVVMLTDMIMLRPKSRHSAHWDSASVEHQCVSSCIKPASSANGKNFMGGTRRGWRGASDEGLDGENLLRAKFSLWLIVKDEISLVDREA